MIFIFFSIIKNVACDHLRKTDNEINIKFGFKSKQNRGYAFCKRQV